LLAFFAYFAGGGLRAGFTGDDLMNLHRYIEQGFAGVAGSMLIFWSTTFRPLGGLFYLTIYNIFGFNPFPFRTRLFCAAGCESVPGLSLCSAGFPALGQQELWPRCSSATTRGSWISTTAAAPYTTWLCFFFISAPYLLLRIRETGRTTVRNWMRFPGAFYMRAEFKGNGRHAALFSSPFMN